VCRVDSENLHTKRMGKEEVIKMMCCSNCKYSPIGGIFHKNCPQSRPLPFDWDVPIDIWREITKRTGCNKWSPIE